MTEKKPKIRGLHRMTPTKAFIYFLLILWAVTTLFPFVWVINNSFKDSSLVVSDSFAPATGEIYSYDQHGQIIREKIMQDEHGRDMYREYLKNEDGSYKLSLTQNFIALSTMRYTNWEDFAGWLDEPLGQFISLYQPAFFERIGLRYLNGFSRERLQLIARKDPVGERYVCAWASAGEAGDLVGRTLILDDGNYHYTLTLTADADKSGDLALTWQDIFASFTLSQGEEPITKG